MDGLAKCLLVINVEGSQFVSPFGEQSFFFRNSFTETEKNSPSPEIRAHWNFCNRLKARCFVGLAQSWLLYTHKNYSNGRLLEVVNTKSQNRLLSKNTFLWPYKRRHLELTIKIATFLVSKRVSQSVQDFF